MEFVIIYKYYYLNLNFIWSLIMRQVYSLSIPCGLPWCSAGKEPACQCRRHKRRGFNPWVRKIPWRRAWQPTLVVLPGEFHGQRSLAGYSPCVCVSCSVVSDSATPWTPLFVEFSRQEYWSGLPLPPPKEKSLGSHKVGYNLATEHACFPHMPHINVAHYQTPYTIRTSAPRTSWLRQRISTRTYKSSNYNRNNFIFYRAQISLVYFIYLRKNYSEKVIRGIIYFSFCRWRNYTF